MTRTILHLVALSLVLCFASSAHAQRTGRDRVLKIDAIELIDHKREVEGKVDFQHQHGRYNYLFSSQANLNTFKADPAKYEIQLGGACGRMGPLSGEGSPKLIAVHEGKIYIFASEQCKRSFIAGPEKLLDRDDAAPAVTMDSITRGRALLDRALIAIGGAEKLDAPKTYRERLSRETKSGEINYVVTDTITMHFPNDLRSENCWNDQCWAYTVVGDTGWTTDSSGTESMASAQCSAIQRTVGRHPLALLRLRRDQHMIVTSDGAKRTTTPANGQPVEVELFTMHMKGATTTLGIDAAGHIRLVAYTGRGPNLNIGSIERIYSAFHEVNGLMLPSRVDVSFEGEAVADDSGTFAVQSIDDPADAAQFDPPQTSQPQS